MRAAALNPRLARAAKTAAVLVVATLFMEAAPAYADAPTDGDGPAGIARKCKKGQVRVKVNKRRVCRKLRSALPRPHAGDRRLTLVKLVLQGPPRRLRDRRHRHPRSLKKLLRRVNPHASRAIQAAIKKGYKRLDKRTVAHTSAVSDCDNPDAGQANDSFTSKSNGESVTVRMSAADGGQMDLALESGHYSVHARLSGGLCDRFDAPSCPTAEGVVEATDRFSLTMGLSVAKDGNVLDSTYTHYTGRTKMRAQVNEDAKLEYFDIDDSHSENVEAGGRNQAFGPVNLIYHALHSTRVLMPSGRYDPGNSAVNVALTVGGVTYGKSELGKVATDIQNGIDKTFAETVAKEIANFKRLEAGWNKPNACVRLQFSPPSRSRKLRRGAHGTMSGQAIAREGAGVSPGRWTLTSQANARFAPGAAQGTDPQFTYDVLRAGPGVFVTAAFHVTSKAGVAEDSWVQETTGAFYRGRAQVTYDAQSTGCPGHTHWSYDGSYGAFGSPQSPFEMSAQNGTAGIGQAHDESASGTFSRPPCGPMDSGCSTTYTLDPSTSGDLLFDVENGTVEVQVDSPELTAADDTCAPSPQSEAFNGSFPASRIGDQTITVNLARTINDPSRGTVTDTGTLTLTRAD